MAQFSAALLVVLAHEGGYGNDPKDSGGETYKGIARNRQAQWAGWSLVDVYKQKPGFPANLEKSPVLQTEVSKFYKTSFWDVLLGDQIVNQAVAESIFDFVYLVQRSDYSLLLRILSFGLLCSQRISYHRKVKNLIFSICFL